MRRIGVLTSGGDAPGMNAAIRAVVRTGIDKGWEVVGICRGYAGLIEGDSTALDSRAVSGVIQRGGTFLGSSRCPEFKTEDGRANALRQIERMRLDGIIIIGGSGTQKGAHALSSAGIPVIGIASTIDNDLYGADITLGVDTALNVALEAIDRLKVTAESHGRAQLVEVMGRDCGYIALMTAIAGGAEAVVIPEREIEPDAVADQLREAQRRGKSHAIVVVAEGARLNANGLLRYFHENEERLGFKLRATTLGHVQRGGTPTAFDRLLGSRLGEAATAAIKQGDRGLLAGLRNGEIGFTPLAEVAGRQQALDLRLLDFANILAK
jgi:6-phosphofructokinase 1